MKNAGFGLGILGLTRVERMTVTSVCALTRSRPRSYSVLPEERGTEADILLVDADDARALMLWENSPMRRNGRPALMISRDPTRVDVQPYALARTNFAARLVKALDQMAIREFMPDVPLDDTQTFDDGLGIAARTPAPLPAHVPRVLVIDSSVIVRTKLRTLLELHGLNADLAGDAEQGLALMRVNRYALVFVDVALPTVDGYATCRQIKAMDRTSTPIVMLANRMRAFDRVRGVMAGCNGHLRKPIAVDALKRVLTDWVPGYTLDANAHRTSAPLRQTG